MTTRLTEEQIAASDEADARGETFAAVSPELLFGKQANSSVLAQTVYSTNPRVYRQKREQYDMQHGFTPRPAEFWHRLPVRGGN